MERPLAQLFETYDTLLVLDTETSGLRFETDEIIELAAVMVRMEAGEPVLAGEYDRLVRLSPGKHLDHRIETLTGISQEDLEADGIPKAQACQEFAALLTGRKTLLAAYNAHFDLSFLFYFLYRDGDPGILRAPDFLDAMSVYKDRRPYPHRLADAIAAYGLEGRVINSHRASDDVKATVEVLKAMDKERSDLCQYINLFGYNPKYGVEGKRIRSVRYEPQPYHSGKLLYE